MVKPLTPEAIELTRQTLEETRTPQGYLNQTAAAQKLGITRSALQNRFRHIEIPTYIAPPEVEFPVFPPDDVSVEQIIAQASERFKRQTESREAKRWFDIRLNTEMPVGLAFVGDPHLDSPGCNWGLLERHIAILRDTPGLYGVNVGDVSDNWVGKLVRLYADSNISDLNAKRLVKYFLADSGVKWLCHILGNHDRWKDVGLLRTMNVPEVPMLDNSAKFNLVFQNGRKCRIWCSHHFPGSSIWNPGHGAQRTAQIKDEAEIYACGHLHDWFIQSQEHARGFVYTTLRARGYKFIDSHADALGYESARFGASIACVIDPKASDGVGFVQAFPCLETAADYLTFKRSKA